MIKNSSFSWQSRQQNISIMILFIEAKGFWYFLILAIPPNIIKMQVELRNPPANPAKKKSYYKTTITPKN